MVLRSGDSGPRRPLALPGKICYRSDKPPLSGGKCGRKFDVIDVCRPLARRRTALGPVAAIIFAQGLARPTRSRFWRRNRVATGADAVGFGKQ
jgi:hypothetical protein